MATVKQTIALNDKVSPVLKTILKNAQATNAAMKALNQTASKGIGSQAFAAANKEVDSLKKKVSSLENQLDNLQQSQGGVNQGFSKWQSGIITANNLLQITQSILEGISATTRKLDSMTTTKARLGLVIEDLQTVGQLQKDIYASAQRTRSSYQTTAEAISQLRLLAESAFPTNDEAIAFTETMQKAFKISGAPLELQNAAIRQMTQALASGRLQGDEFVSIRENAPMIAQAIQKTMGLSNAAFKEAASEGEITTEIIKQAVFEAAEDIDTRFNQMPVTFGEAMTRLANAAEQRLYPLNAILSQIVNSDTGIQMMAGTLNLMDLAIEKLSEFVTWMGQVASMPGFQDMVADVAGFVKIVTSGLGLVLSILGTIFEFVVSNWNVISPILTFAGIAISGIVGALTLYNIASGISSAVTLAMATATAVKTGATLAEVSATAAATAAQWGLNTALYACPLTWILVVTILVIAAIAALALWLYNLWNTNIEFRVGVISIWNSILAFFDSVPVFFQGIGVGIANAFDYARSQVLMIVQNMANGVISIINQLIGLLNKLPGVSIQAMSEVSFGAAAVAKANAKIESRNASYQSSIDNLNTKIADRQAQLDADTAQWEAEFAAKKASLESKSSGNILELLGSIGSGFDTGAMSEAAKAANTGSGSSGFGGAGGGSGSGRGKGTKISGGKLDKVDEVGISDEDLRYLKDIAMVDYVNRYTTLRPVVTANFGDVRETADVNQIVQVIESSVIASYSALLDRG